MSTTPSILVTGSETPAGLAAVRALHQDGFEVWAAVESRTALGARSRAAAGLVDVGDPRADPDEFVAGLAAAAERLGGAVAAGLNLPAIWASLLLGLPFETHGYRSGVRFREEIGDVRSIISVLRRRDFRALRGALPTRRTSHAVFSMRDPRPTLSLLEDLGAGLRRRVRRT